MKPESDRFLAKARQSIERAEKMLNVGLAEDAGRSAYLAGYHAAQAFLFEHNGKVAKTHSGLHSEFARLTVKNSQIDTELRRFLPRTYDLKSICDYELGPSAVVPPEQAAAAIKTARRFVNCITELLSAHN